MNVEVCSAPSFDVCSTTVTATLSCVRSSAGVLLGDRAPKYSGEERMSRRRDQRKKWMKRKRGSQKEDSQPEQRMSSWVVSYLDILGYRSLLHKIDLPPDFETEEQRRVVEQAFIPPIRLRRRLITLVRRSIEGLSEPANLDHIPRESRKIVADRHKAKVMRWDGPDMSSEL